MIQKIRQIKTKGLRWLHLSHPGENELQYLRNNFQFHPLDLEDCVAPSQRPKLDEYENYLFLVLLFPYYDRRERKILAAEIDFFIGSDYLVAVADDYSTEVTKLFDDCMKSEILRDRYLGETPVQLLHELLRRLQDAIFPMLDHVSKDINAIEGQIFAGAERRMVHDILLIKRNIVNFRRIMNAHKNILKKMIALSKPGLFLLSRVQRARYEELVDKTKQIWETIEIQKESIDAFQETNDALISFKTNEILRILTAISVSIFSATLVAAIFGMGVRATPLIDAPYAFWIILALIGLCGSGVMLYFRSRDWL